jgi:hypothetical protein
MRISKIIVSILFAILVSLPAFAQSGGVRATIPFDFYINKHKVDAGDYVVRRTNDLTSSVLTIQRQDGKKGVVVLCSIDSLREKTTSMRGTLVFNRYGSIYQLAEIRDPWMRQVTRLPMGKPKLLFARFSHAPDEQVIVAMN